jgi:hypothetical protein
VSKRTLSADQVIKEIIGPFGEIGNVFIKFWDGSVNSALLATPWDLLGKADVSWREEKGKTLFDGSYLSSPLPRIWVNQQLGLVCCSQLANHINTSFNHLCHDPAGSEEVLLDDDGASLERNYHSSV